MQTQDFATELQSATSTAATTKTEERTRFKRRERKVAAPKTDMQNNVFFKIVAEQPDPVAQKEAMVELMTFTDAETAAKNAAQMEEFSAYLQFQRQEIATQLIEMTDVTTFSDMQSALQDINNDLLDFEDQIGPFMEIINAVRKIQEEGKTTDIIAELREEAAKADEARVKINAIEHRIAHRKDDIEAIKAKIAQHKAEIITCDNDFGFFPWSGVKTASKIRSAELALANVDLEKEIVTAEQDIAAHGVELEAANGVVATSTEFENLAEAKEVLANMLNMSGPEHEEKHQQLIDTAKRFVLTTQTRVGSTLDKSERMSGQIEALGNQAFNSRDIYSVMAEATTEAEGLNAKQHQTLKDEIEQLPETDRLGRMANERQQRDLAKHIKGLNEAASDTTAVLQDLTVSSHRIENLGQANATQIKKTKAIRTSGIAGVADNLSSVLTAIGQAAIDQASTAAQQSLSRMNDTTINLTKEQMLNMAKSRSDDNAQLISNLESMASFGEIIELANQSTHDALTENRDIMSQLRETADDVRQQTKETIDLHSDVIAEEKELG